MRWWRRPRKIRRQLTWTLVLVVVASVLLVGVLNFVAARRLLDEGTEDQLVDIGRTRALSIENGFERVRSQVSALAADLAVVDAVETFSDEYDRLESETISDEQLDALDDAYTELLIEPLAATGLPELQELSLDEVRPGSNAGRYLQINYLLPSIGTGESRRTILDPGDGSTYTEAHTELHPFLTDLAESIGADDLLLISAPDGEIVYSLDKNAELGTNLRTGPYSDSDLAAAVLDRLATVRAGESVVSDLEIWIPANGRPSLFLMSVVRRGSEVIGVLAVQLSDDRLEAVTGADGSWEELGLRSGEAYIVGADELLRTASRAWIEDPVDYLGRVDDPQTATLIDFFGSPVGLQTVDTEPVRVALDGGEFRGTSTNYLGRENFSYSTPIDIPGVQWVIVTDFPTSDARQPLIDYAQRLGVVLLILVPIAAILGLLLARRLTRSIPPVLEAAQAVANGDRDPDIPELGNDEFGDLARRLEHLANRLGEQEHELEAEYDQKRDLLLTVLPPRAIAEDGEVHGTGDAVDHATVVSINVHVTDREFASDEENFGSLIAAGGRLADETAERLGIERIRVGAERYLFIAGIGSESHGADEAFEFAAEIHRVVHELADREQIEIATEIGMSTGRVATGVLAGGALAFTAWGEPVRRALAIAALSRPDEILVDETTVEEASTDGLELVPIANIIDLDGQPMPLHRLLPDPASVSST